MRRRAPHYRVTAYRADAADFAAWSAETRDRDEAYRLVMDAELDEGIGSVRMDAPGGVRAWTRNASGRLAAE